MAITWQSVSAPDLSNTTRLVQDANTGLAQSLSNLSGTVQQIGQDRIAETTAKSKASLENALTEMALRSDNEGDYNAAAISLGKAYGLSNEDALAKAKEGRDYLNAVTALSDDEVRASERELANIDLRNQQANEQLLKEKAGESYTSGLDTRKNFYSNVPSYNKSYDFISSQVEDAEDKTNLQRGIDKFINTHNPDLSELSAALQFLGNPDQTTPWIIGEGDDWIDFNLDGVDSNDVFERLEFLLPKVKADREKVISDSNALDKKYSDKSKSLAQRKKRLEDQVYNRDRDLKRSRKDEALKNLEFSNSLKNK